MADDDKMVVRAREAAKKKNYDYAVELYLEHLKLKPSNIEARKELRAVERERHKVNPPGMLQRGKIAAMVAAARSTRRSPASSGSTRRRRRTRKPRTWSATSPPR